MSESEPTEKTVVSAPPAVVVRRWLDASTATLNAHELPAHMNLISREVVLLGVPGFERLGFDDWHKQCAHEFADAVVRQVSYDEMSVIDAGEAKIMFRVRETIATRDDKHQVNALENIIEREVDGEWRLTQQRVLNEFEALRYGLGETTQH